MSINSKGEKEMTSMDIQKELNMQLHQMEELERQI